MPALVWVVAGAFLGLLALSLAVGPLAGLVVIREREVGIVVRKFSRRGLPAGRLVALDGEAGYQADTLAPGLALRLLAVAVSRRESARGRGAPG